jgi:hypothetical protein
MKKLLFTFLVCIAAAVIIYAFFIPWATVATSVTGITKEASGALSKTGFGSKLAGEINVATNFLNDMGGVSVENTVTGYQIPVLVNDNTSKVAISVAEMFFENTKDLDKKSYLVYLLPVLGLACVLLAFFSDINRLFLVLMVLISGAVSLGGLYKLYTFDVSSLVVHISIQKGLWYSMYAFLFIFVIGMFQLLFGKKAG